MLQDLVAQLKAEGNKDAELQQFCEDGKAKLRTSAQEVLDEIDSKSAEVRLSKAAIDRLSDTVSFTTAEVARLKARVVDSEAELKAEGERVENLKKDHALGREVIAKAVT